MHPYLEKVRKKNPGAYVPWTEDDDQKLKQDYEKGVTTKNLAKSFGRTRGAIVSRIKKLDLQEQQEKTVVQRIPKNPFEKLLVCLAVSRKYKGYCMAGKEMTKEPESSWIRPVSAGGMGELPLRTIQLKDGGKPAFLDMVKVQVKKPLPHYYQSENYLVDGEKRWEKVGRVRFDELRDYCDHMDSLWVNGDHSKNGINDRIPIEVANERCDSSLALIEPQAFCLVLETGLTFKQKIRAEFKYNEVTYKLSVTDPFVEKNYADRAAGRYKIEDRPLYLCISLGEPLNGFCYKLVAGVIGLKGLGKE